MSAHLAGLGPLLPILLSACVADEPRVSCVEQVCAHVPDCAPLTTQGWDWRTEAACLDTFDCGADADACLAAIDALQCLPESPTLDDVEAHTRAMVPVREACR